MEGFKAPQHCAYHTPNSYKLVVKEEPHTLSVVPFAQAPD